MNTILSAKYLMPFKFSGFLQLSKAFTPIITGTASIMYSPTHQTVIVMPNFTYALATNWEIDFTG